ncbi:predicted protein [Histoplasma capsulatum H143]|uniref:Uncharacterized protein n=1 Tax=Ajellomyces capsulatus (strain H143) TaxID=544712 RepID=C6HNH6_AJECH|nr:predicted protein [Histoplasma capsulatum H143]
MTPSDYPAAVGDVSSTKASGSRRWNCHELLDLALKHLEEAKQIIFNSSPVIFFMINPPKPGLHGPADDRGFHETHPEPISNALTVYNKVSGISDENIVGLFEVIQPRY